MVRGDIHWRTPVGVLGVVASNDVKEDRLELPSHRANLSAPNLSAIDFDDRRNLRGRPRHEAFVGGIELASVNRTFDRRQA